MKPHNIDTSSQEQAFAPDGTEYWRTATPLPLYTHRLLFFPAYQCECGEKFKKESDYRKHYRFAVAMFANLSKDSVNESSDSNQPKRFSGENK